MHTLHWNWLPWSVICILEKAGCACWRCSLQATFHKEIALWSFVCTSFSEYMLFKFKFKELIRHCRTWTTAVLCLVLLICHRRWLKRCDQCECFKSRWVNWKAYVSRSRILNGKWKHSWHKYALLHPSWWPTYNRHHLYTPLTGLCNLSKSVSLWLDCKCIEITNYCKQSANCPK